MDLSQAEGRTYPPVSPVAVTAEAVAAFSEALGMPASDVAPPTFGAKLASPAWQQLFTDPELGLDLNHTIHGEQRFSVARPLRVGDEVVAQATIARVKARGPMAFITLVVDFTVAGEPVGSSTSTLIHRKAA
ncbi:FAS1-like dehydratase domain-containing protein [Parenemella sanctibonifatiensis]|uniref:FAS1-like dehydratase domain-containing protein n=1 Tax=Parenemella sanctibonifatiensis TaxID=2016505 RepID=A0A255ECM2_9ACTN|nr:MaoC family dehydratase N-terminal domain-containing protein [Parenemella sanctibonifatiensis]OYN89010.1 hypothetical protein CGZ91_12105 [Parenemella sanctibonifatiensis]